VRRRHHDDVTGALELLIRRWPHDLVRPKARVRLERTIGLILVGLPDAPVTHGRSRPRPARPIALLCTPLGLGLRTPRKVASSVTVEHTRHRIEQRRGRASARGRGSRQLGIGLELAVIAHRALPDALRGSATLLRAASRAASRAAGARRLSSNPAIEPPPLARSRPRAAHPAASASVPGRSVAASLPSARPTSLPCAAVRSRRPSACKCGASAGSRLRENPPGDGDVLRNPVSGLAAVRHGRPAAARRRARLIELARRSSASPDS